MRIENLKGGYAFLRGISPYSAGVVASRGFEIEHVRLASPLPVKTGFDAIAAYLRRLNRPRQALCAIELRSPRPFTFRGFSEFNAGYVAILKSWEILLDGVNPVARTNVAPEVHPPPEPMLYGFSIAVPSQISAPAFVVAGAGELPEGSLDPHDVIRRGETSADALREKARFVMGLMSSRLAGLGAAWPDVTAIDIYTVHDIHPFLASEILARVGEAARLGVHWHFTRPPIESIEYEMDLRGCRREVIL
ncbi:MAG TPA: hypothetical protein VJN43_18240 [Bryobacteraceae bacterium]|nr:hypothetical protein [Bryobacteraceae bacterium]